jgi:hypothetical protein
MLVITELQTKQRNVEHVEYVEEGRGGPQVVP